MGSIGTTARQAAFDGQIHKKGLDLHRCKINNDEGTYVAAPDSTIRAAQFVTYDADGFVVATTDGLGIIGVAKHSKEALGYSVHVDEPIVLNGTTAADLDRANVSNVSVRSEPDFGGTLYTVTTDYTVSTTNGTVTRVALGSIGDGDTVYVTYTYALVASDFEIDGRTFRNQSNDRVTGQEDRIVVITDWARLYTIEWDSSKAYGLTSDFKLYASSEGKATSTSGTDFVGRVHQLPTADDPYLGITIHGNPVA
jgi:hypothetical protein